LLLRRVDYAGAENGTLFDETDSFRRWPLFPNKIRAKLWRRAMRGVQGGVAKALIALHVQHDYFLLIKRRTTLLIYASLKG
jgi:hypothetical protein